MKTIYSLFFLCFLPFAFFGQIQLDYEWTLQTGGADDDYVEGLDKDSDGNFYFFVETTSAYVNICDSACYGGGLLVIKLDSMGTLIRTTNISCSDYIAAMTLQLTPDNDVYLMGWFRDTAYFEQQMVVDTTAAGVSFLAKMDPEGNFEWVTTAYHSPQFVGYDMFVDSGENIYLTGICEDSSMIIGNDTVHSLCGDHNMPVVKYDSTGSPVWGIFASGGFLVRGMDIVMEPTGNLLVMGDYHGAKLFYNQDSIVPDTQENILLASVNPSGSFNWVKIYGYENSAFPWSIELDPEGNIYLTGRMKGDLYFNGDTLNVYGFFPQFGVLKFSPDGIFDWIVTSEPPQYPAGESDGFDIAFNDEGHLLVTGIFNYIMDIGDFSLVTDPYGIYFDNFLVEISAEGEVLSAMKLYGQTYLNDYSRRRILADGNDIYFCGFFTGSGTYGNQYLTSFGYIDNFISKLTVTNVSISEPAFNFQSAINIYSHSGRIFINNLSEGQNYKVEVLNLAGMVVHQSETKGERETSFSLQRNDGIYLVSIQSGEEKHVHKIFFRK